jgi:hypothetical protein
MIPNRPNVKRFYFKNAPVASLLTILIRTRILGNGYYCPTKNGGLPYRQLVDGYMLKEVLDKSLGARRNQATKPTKTRFQIKKDFTLRHRS